MPHPIDVIVRLANKAHPGPYETAVSVNAKGETASWPFGRSYIVNTRKVAICKGLVIVLETIHGALELEIEYSAQCKVGKEMTLVRAVAQAVTPQSAVDCFVEDIVLAHFADCGEQSFLRDLAANCHKIAESIQRAAEETLGLKVTAAIRVNTGATESQRLGPLTVLARPTDSDIAFNVELEANLVVVDPVLAHFKDANLEGLRLLLTRRIEEQLCRRTINELYFGLSQDIPRRLRDELSSLLAENGRDLANLTLRCDFAAQSQALRSLEQTKQGTFRFPYESPRYSGTVEVEVTYDLELDDLSKYISSGIASLKDWVEDMVRTISKSLLFDAGPENFWESLEESQKELERKMATAAMQMGYKLRHFTTITDHLLDRLRKGVALEPFEDTFILNSPRQVKVELRTVLGIRVSPERLRTASSFGAKGSILAAIESTVRQILRSVLLHITPEEFYLYFEAPRPVTDGETQSEPVRERIQRELFAKLRDNYGVEVTSCLIVRLQTELVDLIEALCRELGEVELSVNPPGGIPETFDLTFRVIGVVPQAWDMFQLTKPTIQKLASSVKRHLELQLKAKISPATLTLSIEETRDHATDEAIQFVQRQFGLYVAVEAFARRSNTFEDKNLAVFQHTLTSRTNARIQEITIEDDASIKQLLSLTELRGEFVAKAAQAKANGEPERAQDYATAIADLDVQVKQLKSQRVALLSEARSPSHLLTTSSAAGSSSQTSKD